MIDRKALVTLHHPVLLAERPADPDAAALLTASPFSVGNGEFAFTADFTGLQTLREDYRRFPLCTMSQWGWHSFPGGAGEESALRLQPFDTYGRQVGYASDASGQQALFNHLRQNPHRLHLGAFSFRFFEEGSDGLQAGLTDYHEVRQTLDLWNGSIQSKYSVFGRQVAVETLADAASDTLAVHVFLSPQWYPDENRAVVELAFPYGSPAKEAADWGAPERHETLVLSIKEHTVTLRRVLDGTLYDLQLRFEGALFCQTEKHRFELRPVQREFWFSCRFAPVTTDSLVKEAPANASTERAPDFQEARERTSRWWNYFWSRGGAMRLNESSDPRAVELERRIVLSQYLTAIQCAGSVPPAETGLTCNSWYGKFHLEMHPWHAAHFPLWGRPELLERSMAWYMGILPGARELAKSQGFAGARWPKMTDPSGRPSPSSIAVHLAWQQPHPILFAELLYQSNPTRDTLEKYAPMVIETAEFMASYAHMDDRTGRYVLGPPLIPVQETHRPEDVLNPPFELAYFQWALRMADIWRHRLSRAVSSSVFTEVADRMAPLPMHDGVYIAHERCPDTFTRPPFFHDHPAMLGAMGFVPGEFADPLVMRRTLERVLETWDRDSMWGWDFPMMAMTCVRLGLPSLAVDVLMMDAGKNRYLPNGHNPQSDRGDLPLYLPGNGGLLLATGMMAAGCNLVYGQCDWRPDSCKLPGFPDNGRWTVQAEGLRPYL